MNPPEESVVPYVEIVLRCCSFAKHNPDEIVIEDENPIPIDISKDVLNAFEYIQKRLMLQQNTRCRNKVSLCGDTAITYIRRMHIS
jgi:hypothetical protein